MRVVCCCCCSKTNVIRQRTVALTTRTKFFSNRRLFVEEILESMYRLEIDFSLLPLSPSCLDRHCTIDTLTLAHRRRIGRKRF